MKRSFHTRFAVAAVLIASTCWAQGPGEVEPAALGVIEKSCLSCHNADAKTSGLDLTSLDGALTGGAHGPALKLGSAEQSLLYRKIAAGEMPVGNSLPDDERDVIRLWIEAGAPWSRELSQAEKRPRGGPDWWSLQPLSSAEPPPRDIAPEEWRLPIDRFIFEELVTKGLKPSPPADRAALIRRAAFDLTGLPPTPEEIDAFINDPSDNAYERLLDRLLASPHYGERWGRHWLDVVRFGESHGYEQNHLRDNAWPFRDYVIRSLNDDRPFDQMVLDHLAGDQVAAGNPDVEVATAFLVAGPHDTVGINNIEGKLQKRANDLNDIISATAGSFLGLTVHCARCHDHKFDPIQQADYYRMQSIFDGVHFDQRVIARADQVKQRERRARPVEAELERIGKELEAGSEQAQPQVKRQRESIKALYRPPVDAKGTEETFDPVEARYVRMRITGTYRGTPRLDELEIWSAGPEPHNVALASAGAKASAVSTRKADDDPNAYSVDHILDGDYAKRWISDDPDLGEVTVELAQTERISRVFWSRDRLGAFQKRFLSGVPTLYTFEASMDGKTWRQVADTVDRLPYTEAEQDELVLMTVLDADGKRRRQSLLQRKVELQADLDAIPKLPTVYAGRFEQPKEPTHLFKRGNPMNKGEAIAPGGLSTFDNLFRGFELDLNAPEGERRLAFARWITDDRNPLTPRVLANRLWHYHFGSGLVGTPSDFGFNGERPTHPELLDWLARRLRTYGWRLKPLHKEIMMSAAYRQSSPYDPDSANIDREARLLWRFPPRRLEAEAIRDAILAVSGKLDPKMGGPGFRLYKYTVDNVATYYPRQAFGQDTFRRSVYHQAARSVRVDLLGQYDCPDSALPAPKREVSTSPLQALSLLNNPFMLQQAEFFAERLRHETGDTEARVDRAYRLAFGRAPTPQEQAAAVDLIGKHGLAIFCRAIFNANEFLYVM
jgi:hypothetical protein